MSIYFFRPKHKKNTNDSQMLRCQPLHIRTTTMLFWDLPIEPQTNQLFIYVSVVNVPYVDVDICLLFQTVNHSVIYIYLLCI